MLSEGTLLSGGDKDRKISAWDSLQNYKRITDTKVFHIRLFIVLMLQKHFFSFLKLMVASDLYIHNDQVEMMETFTLALQETTSWKARYKEDLTRCLLHNFIFDAPSERKRFNCFSDYIWAW